MSLVPALQSHAVCLQSHSVRLSAKKSCQLCMPPVRCQAGLAAYAHAKSASETAAGVVVVVVTLLLRPSSSHPSTPPFFFSSYFPRSSQVLPILICSFPSLCIPVSRPPTYRIIRIIARFSLATASPCPPFPRVTEYIEVLQI